MRVPGPLSLTPESLFQTVEATITNEGSAPVTIVGNGTIAAVAIDDDTDRIPAPSGGAMMLSGSALAPKEAVTLPVALEFRRCPLTTAAAPQPGSYVLAAVLRVRFEDQRCETLLGPPTTIRLS